MIEITRCPVCNEISFAPFLVCIDYSVSHETFNINKCIRCELLITSPRPSIDQFDKYYASPNYTSHINSAKNFIDKIYLGVRNFTLQWKVSLIEKNSQFSSGKTILDFGCGVGEFLKVAKVKGWDTTGIEPSLQARQHAAEIISNDIKPSLQDIAQFEKKFQIITLWHVLEHVDNLNATVQELKSLLHDNGTIFIAIPNINSWDAKYYKQHWAAYDVPRHLWHFKPNSLQILMQKHGLKITRVIPMRLDAFYISLLSEKYKNGSFSVRCIANALVNGLRSNYHARKNMGYSSLIYIVRKCNM